MLQTQTSTWVGVCLPIHVFLYLVPTYFNLPPLTKECHLPDTSYLPINLSLRCYEFYAEFYNFSLSRFKNWPWGKDVNTSIYLGGDPRKCCNGVGHEERKERWCVCMSRSLVSHTWLCPPLSGRSWVSMHWLQFLTHWRLLLEALNLWGFQGACVQERSKQKSVVELEGMDEHYSCSESRSWLRAYIDWGTLLLCTLIILHRTKCPQHGEKW